MRLIVKTVTRVTIGLVFMFGLFLTFQGHLNLGGGIAGGVIVALALILDVLAFGRAQRELIESRQKALASMVTGAVFFLLLACSGYAGYGLKMCGNYGFFLYNFLPKGAEGKILSAGLIPFYNLAITLALSGALFSVFLSLTYFVVQVKEEVEE